MSTPPAGIPHVRNTSPLSPDVFRQPVQTMPQVIAPRWMRLSMAWSVVLTILIGVLTLLSPMDEYVVAPGEVRPAEYAFVFSRSAGILESIEVLDNQPVKRGQVLARLDGW
ncbi:MAG TPA: efflux RND transporter periplasmic adaptor subunit, partial [Terrimicrobiaceae bacterium]|nr:efflux RND transporter periplasmic adaptor subunit [Terrimicrobiaceae bacterium]